MTGTYRIKFADLLTDVVRDEFPVTGVGLETRISAAGQMQGAIPIARGDYAMGRRLNAIKSSGASAVYVTRNGAPWWDGVVWTMDPSKDERGNPARSLNCGTIESYLDRVKLLTDLPAMPGTDQLAIARSFIDHMQTDPYADLNITYDPAQISGIIRDRQLYQAASRPTYLQMLTDSASLDQGFEFLINTITDPTTSARTRRLRLGYPTINSTVVHDLYEPGGAILSYTFNQDGSRGGTYLVAQGNACSSTVHIDTAALAAGYPRLDATTSYSDVTDTAVLETHAAADLVRAKVPVLVPQVRIRPDGAPDITPACLGDTIRLHLKDENFPDGAVLSYRLVGMTVNPPERGVPETADLVLN